MKSKEARTERVTIRLTATQKDRLEKRSKSSHRDVADYVRLLIDRDLESKDADSWTT